MKLLLSILLVVMTNISMATEIVEYVVKHQSVEEHLIATDKFSIEQIFTQYKDQLVEKIDIQSYSIDFVKGIQNEMLSGERLDAVYSYLTVLIEDENNIEKINVNSSSIKPDDRSPNYQGSYTRIKIYFLSNANGNPAPGIEKILFPEEFQQEEIETYIPKSFETNTIFNIEDIFFHGNSAVYNRESEESLEKLLDFMTDNPSVEIRIDGHVNGKLSKSYLKEAARSNPERKVYQSSEHLSLERARSIKEYLVDNGISADRILVDGKGADEMKYKRPKNKKEEAENRRIEVVIIKT